MFDFINRYRSWFLAGAILISFLMHLPYANTDLRGAHVWRQSQTQTNINNFAYKDSNIFNPRRNNEAHSSGIYRMEFPLMQWLFALFYKTFGPHIAISRILSFIIGAFSILGIYQLCKGLFNSSIAGVFAAWALSFSPAFYYYTFCPMPDNMALCFSIWFLVYYFRYLKTVKQSQLIISGIMLCIATLTKLPFIVYYIITFSSILNKREKTTFKPAAIIGLLLLPAIAWYVYVIPSWAGNPIVEGVLNSSDIVSDIINIVPPTLYSTLPELILNYGSALFFVAGIYFFFRNRLYLHRLTIPLLLPLLGVIAYYIYEIRQIGLVHDYYLYPFFPFIFILVAYGYYHLFRVNIKPVRIIALLALLTIPFSAALRINGRWYNDNVIGFNKVYFYQKDTLHKLIPNGSYCVVGNDESGSINLYYLNRRGWSFAHNNLSKEQLNFYISEGAEYLLSDCLVEEKNEMKPMIGNMVYQEENLKVYQLKKDNR